MTQIYRPNQRDILPTAVKMRSFSQITIDNGDIFFAYFTIALGGGSFSTFTFNATPRPDIILGVMPYEVTYLEGTSLLSALPIPSLVSANNYQIQGPYMYPDFSTDTFQGSNGFNIKIQHTLRNEAGPNPANIIRIARLRYTLGGGGEV